MERAINKVCEKDTDDDDDDDYDDDDDEKQLSVTQQKSLSKVSILNKTHMKVFGYFFVKKLEV